MAIKREAPKCEKCGKDIKPKLSKNKSDNIIGFVGDRFLMWDYEGHRCHFDKGEYVSRSAYQKVVEENKKLIQDIKILVGSNKSEDFTKVFIKWKDKFKNDEDFKQALKDIFKKVR